LLQQSPFQEQVIPFAAQGVGVGIGVGVGVGCKVSALASSQGFGRGVAEVFGYRGKHCTINNMTDNTNASKNIIGGREI